MVVSGHYEPEVNGGDKDEDRPAAHVIGRLNVMIRMEPTLCDSLFCWWRDTVPLLLQGGLKKGTPILCAGIRGRVGLSHPEESLTSFRTAPCKSTRPDSSTSTPEWSWSLRTVTSSPHLFTLCLWGEKESPYPWPWWRPTERVSAPSIQDARGPQRVTSAPPCSCRNKTGSLWMFRSPILSVMNIMPTSLVFTRSEELEVFVV